MAHNWGSMHTVHLGDGTSAASPRTQALVTDAAPHDGVSAGQVRSATPDSPSSPAVASYAVPLTPTSDPEAHVTEGERRQGPGATGSGPLGAGVTSPATSSTGVGAGGARGGRGTASDAWGDHDISADGSRGDLDRMDLSNLDAHSASKSGVDAMFGDADFGEGRADDRRAQSHVSSASSLARRRKRVIGYWMMTFVLPAVTWFLYEEVRMRAVSDAAVPDSRALAVHTGEFAVASFVRRPRRLHCDSPSR